MKKIICVILSLFTVCVVLSGCSGEVSRDKYNEVVSERDSLLDELNKLNGNSNSDSNSKDDGDNGDKTENSVGKTQVLVDQNNVKIAFTGIEFDDYGRAEIKLKIENKRDSSIMVQQRNLSINGTMTDGSFSCDVAAGKSANDGITLYSSDLEENGITKADDIKNVEFYFTVVEGDTWDNIFDSETISLDF